MTDPQVLQAAILERLSQVIDPETGTDVVHMRLIEDLQVDDDGYVSLTFRPSSPFCPLAIPLADNIRQALASVCGVSGQDVQIVGLALSDELMAALRQAMEAI